MGITSTVGKGLLPHVSKVAPELSSHFVHESMRRAIDGVGPLPGAAASSDKILGQERGDVDRAIHEVIEDHATKGGNGATGGSDVTLGDPMAMIGITDASGVKYYELKVTPRTVSS